MAKMFYTAEEAQKKLSVDEEGLKGLIRDGKIREFHDGPRLMFQVKEVDSEASGLTPTDKFQSPEPARKDDAGEALSLSDFEGPPADSRDDTSLKGMNLSSPPSGEGEEQIEIEAPVAAPLDDTDEADPFAKTQLTPSLDDQLSLEGTGSGSGLLDLTRESDDTSLGAELLDEIYPGDQEGGDEIPSGSGTQQLASGSGGSGLATELSGSGLASTSGPGLSGLASNAAVDSGDLGDELRGELSGSGLTGPDASGLGPELSGSGLMAELSGSGLGMVQEPPGAGAQAPPPEMAPEPAEDDISGFDMLGSEADAAEGTSQPDVTVVAVPAEVSDASMAPPITGGMPTAMAAARLLDRPDPTAKPFTVLMVLSALVLGLVGLAVAGMVMGIYSPVVSGLSNFLGLVCGLAWIATGAVALIGTLMYKR